MSTAPADLADLVGSRLRDVQDFPKAGVTFKDITPLLDDPAAFGAVVEALAAAGRDAAGGVVVDKVVGMEARGFIFAAPVALALGVGFVPVRKPGKLPWETRSRSYDLEYGSETLQIHTDAISAGQRVLVIDDVLATGGTARATAELVEESGGVVHALAFVVELGFLDGRSVTGELPVSSLLSI